MGAQAPRTLNVTKFLLYSGRYARGRARNAPAALRAPAIYSAMMTSPEASRN